MKSLEADNDTRRHSNIKDRHKNMDDRKLIVPPRRISLNSIATTRMASGCDNGCSVDKTRLEILIGMSLWKRRARHSEEWQTPNS